MPRRLLNFLTILSLLLCVASLALWVRSFYRWDLGQYVARDGWALTVMIGSGAADFISSAELAGVTSNWSTDPAPVHPAVWWFRFDFADLPAWFVRIPLWSPAVLAGVLPAVRGWRRVRRGRLRKVGYCVHCRYDLTGNVSGVCPECGLAAERARAS